MLDYKQTNGTKKNIRKKIAEHCDFIVTTQCKIQKEFEKSHKF